MAFPGHPLGLGLSHLAAQVIVLSRTGPLHDHTSSFNVLIPCCPALIRYRILF